MVELHRTKHRLHQHLYSWPAILVLAVITILIFHGTWEVYKKAEIAHEHRNEAARELAELKERKSALHANVSALQSERGIEERIREKYGVAKQGEEVVVIVDAPRREDAGTDQGNQNWWQTMLDWIGL